MEEKDNYTKQEVEKMFDEGLSSFIKYADFLNNQYKGIERKTKFGYCNDSDYKKFDETKNELNLLVEECNQKLPKSLIDKLGIKKVE